MFTSQNFFKFDNAQHDLLFPEDQPVWTALDRLSDYLERFFQKPWPLSGITGQIGRPLAIYNNEVRDDISARPTGLKGAIQVFKNSELLEDAAVIMPGAHLFDDRIIIGPGTVVEPGALIKGPTVIGRDTEVRQGAYMRGNCLVGNQCVVGHATEIKGSIMLDGAKAGHFAYIGDSILGRDANLGAGTKLANLKMIPGSISISVDKKRHDTGRRKLGAILGDETETGCNSVTSPGTLIGAASIIYPGVTVPGGYYPDKSIIAPVKGSLRITSLK